MKIFLTGATGYIGGSVAERLLREGHAITGLVRTQQRAAIDQAVFDAATQGVRSVVIRPTMIYGEGRGSRKESAQVPALIDNAKKAGVGLHIGKGENIWANVHIDDVTELYLLALQKAPAGALYYAENGEELLKNVAASISRML